MTTRFDLEAIMVAVADDPALHEASMVLRQLPGVGEQGAATAIYSLGRFLVSAENKLPPRPNGTHRRARSVNR